MNGDLYKGWWPVCAWGLRGTVPALAGNVGTGGAFALCARGIRVWTFLCSLRTKPALPVSRGVAGSVPHMTHMRDRPLYRPLYPPTDEVADPAVDSAVAPPC